MWKLNVCIHWNFYSVFPILADGGCILLDFSNRYALKASHLGGNDLMPLDFSNESTMSAAEIGKLLDFSNENADNEPACVQAMVDIPNTCPVTGNKTITNVTT